MEVPAPMEESDGSVDDVGRAVEGKANGGTDGDDVAGDVTLVEVAPDKESGSLELSESR